MELNNDNWPQHASEKIDPSSWTAVIPAAGRGSRLGYDLPKILYPVAGRMILEWLLDLLEPRCGRLIFVLSPDGRGPVEQALQGLVAGRYDIVIQEDPTGMGDAVQLACPVITTAHTAVIWGDQVALRPGSVEGCLRLHAGPLQPDITCPTLWRDKPYIHFNRRSDGQLESVLQAREGDVMPATGESDTGFFCFETQALRELTVQLREMPEGIGRLTREYNLLPVIPLAARQGRTVITPRLITLEETVGVNSKDDVTAVEAFLRTSHVCSQRQGN